jgi:CRP/FNR family cyclic AMP-dependent transcriptional regulator
VVTKHDLDCPENADRRIGPGLLESCGPRTGHINANTVFQPEVLRCLNCASRHTFFRFQKLSSEKTPEVVRIAEMTVTASEAILSRPAKVTDDRHTTEAPTAFELLRTIRLLDELPNRLLAKLAPMASVECAAAKVVLFKEGALCDRVFFVIDGIVALDMYVPQRDPTRILTVGGGELLAWSAVLSDQRMTATATVLDDARFIALAAQPLRQLCDADHEIGFAFMRCMASALSRRLLATRLQLLDLFAEPQPI